MNILLLCNKQNLIGNKVLIYSTLYCNSDVRFFICLTEDIGEQEKQNLNNLAIYLDNDSKVIFDTLDLKESLEEHFFYLENLLYLAADTVVTQTIENVYEELEEDNEAEITVPLIREDYSEQRFPIIFFDFENIRKANKKIFIKHDNLVITELSYSSQELNYFTDDRIGFGRKFSFYINMPIIFWFTNDNKKIYETNITEWCKLYPSFSPMVRQVQMAETIYF